MARARKIIQGFAMMLQMYISDKLVDSADLSPAKINDGGEREIYLQSATNERLEKWADLIKQQKREVDFFIQGKL